ncbi:MAG: helix-turn-helix domain-containing protein [Thauera sp.]
MKNAPDRKAAESANTNADSAPLQASLPGLERAAQAPTLPSPNTRPAEALALLLKRGALDQRQFLDDAGGWRLAAAVHVLRGLGWHIETEYAPVTLAGGEPGHIARYRLDRAAHATHQAGGIAPELAGWLALLAVVFLLPLSARWFA